MQGMRIALVHPTYWPEVRRGSERFVHDLAAYMAGRGHDVTVLTSHRGWPRRSRDDGFTVVRGWRPPARLQPNGVEPHTSHAPMALVSSALRRYDIVHALHVTDAWAISWWSRLSGRPLILSVMGYPDRRSLDGFRGRRALLRRAARRARAVHVLSDAARRELERETGIGAVVIPPGTETTAFGVELARAPRPTVFCAATPRDPRKRVPLLIEAFGQLRGREPNARLVIDTGGDARAALAGSSPGVQLVDAGAGGLAAHYGSAWVTALPSEREAFGLVLVESLAAGTPAVGMGEGGVPEVLDDPGVGVICERAEPGALAEALARGLDLSRRAGIREACRRHAERWDWREVGPRFEQLYRDAAGSRRRAEP
jgi:phosphatidylinositol alpha-mannosyltransferase